MSFYFRILAPLILFLFISTNAELAHSSIDECKKLYKNKNYSSALKICRELAMIGNKEAQFITGMLYANMKGGIYNKRQSLAMAKEWLQKSADQDHIGAITNLAIFYHKGITVNKNLKTAAKLYEKAAIKGHPIAQSKLGKMYFLGHGVEKNLEQALKWFIKAAEADEADAMIALGGLYEYGMGVKKDLTRAYAWYSLAIVSPGRNLLINTQKLDAEEKRKRVKSQLSNDQLEKAKMIMLMLKQKKQGNQI